MKRAERRRAMRAFGWRGTKAKRQKQCPPEVAAAFVEAVRERAARLEQPEG